MKLMLALAAVAALLAGCSSGGSGDTSAGGGASPADKARWPGEGNYDYSMTYNGCKIEYHAQSQADLCLQIEDQALDNCGARDTRESIFSRQCGGDFEERNLKSVMIDGWDDYLQRRCTVQSTTTFPRKSDYCAFLANESQHNGCFWSQRRQEFQKYNCAGDFSQQPQKVDPAPSQPSQPTQPTQPGQPSRPVSSFQQLVADYAAVGIRVSHESIGSSYPLPGRPSHRQMFDAIIPVLETMLPDFQHTDFKISQLVLNDYTSYGNGRLDLSVSMTEADLRRYIVLQNQAIKLYLRTGMEIDYGIAVFSHLTGDQLSLFQAKIQAFSQMNSSGTLKALKPMVDKINLTDKHFMNFFDRSYDLDEKTFATELQQDLPLLKKLAAVPNVEYDDFIDLNGDTSGLSTFATFASSNAAALAEVARLNKGTKIKASANKTYTMFSSQELEIGIEKFKVTDGLTALLKLAPVINRLNVEIDVQGYDLDADFVKAAALVISHESTLKKLKLTKLTLSSGHSQMMGDDEVWVGGDDTPQQFEKVLSKK